VRHKDSNDNDSHTRNKPAQIGLRTSKMKGFLSAVIKNTHQEKNAAKENHSTKQRSVRSTEMGCAFFSAGRVLLSRLMKVFQFLYVLTEEASFRFGSQAVPAEKRKHDSSARIVTEKISQERGDMDFALPGHSVRRPKS
jgi:hypothetical protein